MNLDLNIYNFTDCKSFLNAYVKLKKEKSPAWNLSTWTRSLGFNSTSTLTRFVQGQRTPGPELEEKLIHYFGFDSGEAEFFRDLIKLNRFKRDPKLTLGLLERLQAKSNSTGARFLDLDSFSLISNWYFTPIRELIKLSDFREDPHWIKSKLRFKLSTDEIENAIRVLIRLGLLKRNSSERLEISDATVHIEPSSINLAVKKYHDQMLDHARTSINELDVSEFESRGTSLAIKKEKISEAKALIVEFQKKFEALIEERSSTCDAVYQLEVIFFPITMLATETNQ